MLKIKETKSIKIEYDDECDKEFWGVFLTRKEKGLLSEDSLFIPMSKIFQVKRGLEAAVQRFYRRKKK